MLSKILLVLAVIAALWIGFSVFHEPEITNVPSPGQTIVAFGDSLVEGVGATPGNDFISVLSNEIGKPIINMGRSGETTVTALSRLESVIEPNPKVVIVLLGGNDYLRRIPIDETFSNLGKIVNRIHESGSAVLLLGVRGGALRDTYNSRFEKFAKEHKTGFVPNVLDDLIGNREYMSDAIHPNDAGYRIISEKVEPVLKKILNTK